MKKQGFVKTILRPLAVVAAVVLGGLASSPSASAASHTCYWTGAAGDNKFSTAANWDDCQGGAPDGKQELVFHNKYLTADVSLVNDIPHLHIAGLVFEAQENNTNQYTIDFKDVSLSGHLNAGKGVYPELNGNITLTTDVTSNGDGVTGGGISIDAKNFSFTRYGLGGIYSRGSFIGSGTVTASAGTIEFRDMKSFTGRIRVLGKGVQFKIYPDQLNPAAQLEIDGDVLLCGLEGATMANSLTISGTIDTVISCHKHMYTYLFDTRANVEWTGPITLESPVTVDGVGEFKISGPLSGNYAISQQPGSAGRILNVSSHNTSKTPMGLLESALLETKLDRNAPTENFFVNRRETGILTGLYASAEVAGVLKGTGQLVSELTVNQEAVIAPGMSPGCLTMGRITIHGQYQVELGGKAACREYDQIKITGPVTPSTEAVELDPASATLAIFRYGNFVQTKGDQFVIIDNATTMPVHGHFAGLPEGAEIKAGNAVFRITYRGGDGNDVVLRAENSLAAPKAPNTGVKSSTSSPLVTIVAGVVVLAALGFLLKRTTSRR